MREVLTMPRQARLILEGSCYHIINRGNGKETIFKDSDDLKKYLKLLIKYKAKYGFKLYGWCLMTNHTHLVMQSNKLSNAMHGINLSYAQYFGFKYNKPGHLWEGRYKSFVMQKDQYLINCLSYVEYNPVRANIVARPEDYQWSSYSVRILGQPNALLDDLVL